MLPLARIPLAALTALAATATFAAPPNMAPGLWEITTRTEMPGMPMAMPAQTIRHCFRASDLKDTRDSLPVDKECRIEDLSQSGNAVSWKMSCKTGGGSMRGEGRITHDGQSYSGTVSLRGRVEGQDVAMNSTYSGRRVGDCK